MLCHASKLVGVMFGVCICASNKRQTDFAPLSCEEKRERRERRMRVFGGRKKAKLTFINLVCILSSIPFSIHFARFAAMRLSSPPVSSSAALSHHVSTPIARPRSFRAAASEALSALPVYGTRNMSMLMRS